MRVIISGPVTQAHLDEAELIAGIAATSFVTNGRSAPPCSQRETYVIPVCKMRGDDGEAVRARNYTLAHNADALVCAGENEHLINICRQYGMPVYEVAA